jgi:hypothetical protein
LGNCPGTLLVHKYIIDFSKKQKNYFKNFN